MRVTLTAQIISPSDVQYISLTSGLVFATESILEYYHLIILSGKNIKLNKEKMKDWIIVQLSLLSTP